MVTQVPLRTLSGLLDFDCAARWGSFKLAAEELHKTPAAVSLQIKQLESALGFLLFVRHPRHISLTEKGKDLAASVAKFLGDLRKKVSALQEDDEENILRISTTHSFAIKWLVPRLSEFSRQFPDIDIRVDSNDDLVDLDDDSIDVILRFGPVDPADPARLFSERMVAAYSPALLQPGQAALTLADLPHHPLLYGSTTETWMRLLAENRVLDVPYHFARGYGNVALRTQATVAGQGVGLVSFSVAYQDIQSGALKLIDCRSAPYSKGYRFLVNDRKKDMRKVTGFRLWLSEEMGRMQDALARATAGMDRPAAG